MSKHKLALIVFFALAALFLQLRPSYDVDVFWRLKTGQLMLEHGELIRRDPFTSTRAGEPVATPTWGTELIWAVLYRIGSWRLLHQLNAVFFAGAFLIGVFSLRRREASTLAAVLAMSLGLLVALPYCEIRANTCSMVGFAALLWVMRTSIPPVRKFLLAAGVLLLWQNLHPSAVFALLTVGIYADADWLRYFRKQQTTKPWCATAVAVTAGLSMLATPAGVGAFATSRYNAQIARELNVSEWMPMWHSATWQAGAWSVWVVLGVSLLLLIRMRRQVRLEEAATLIVLTAVSLPVHRFSLFLAVAMVPIWTRWIHLFLAKPPAASTETNTSEPETARSGIPVRPPLAAGVIAAALLAALALPRLGNFQLFDDGLPLAGVRQLKESGFRGVIYNYREWGGPLIFKGYPDWKVTIDGRLYLFPREQWRRYEATARGEVSVLEVERRYHPDAFFLRPRYHRAFIERLEQRTDWEETYADPTCRIFIKRRGPPAVAAGQ